MDVIFSIVLIIGAVILAIWALREVFAWYSKRNKQLELQIKTNKLLTANNDLLERQIVLIKEYNDFFKELLKTK